MKTKEKRLSILCPCAGSATCTVGVVEEDFRRRGWKYVQPAFHEEAKRLGYDFEGMCPECQELEDD